MEQQSRSNRIVPWLGIALGLTSLLWQYYTYRQGFLEHALVRLSIQFHLQKSPLQGSPPTYDYSYLRQQKGDLVAEVVNIGQHPLFLKRVILQIPCASKPDQFQFFEPPESFKNNAAIEPGAAAEFTIHSWDFSHDPLDLGGAREAYCVEVVSNRGSVVAQTSSALPVSVSIPLPREIESKKGHKGP